MHLILGVHCHQPLGNFDHVIDEACDRAYLPFLEVLARHPDVPCNVHYSGSLLEWLEANRPEVIEVLQGLGDRIEWMSGGFYEPILPAVPPRDRIAQIRRLTDHIEDRFGQRPRGIWLTERVWDPSLPESLAEAGVAYLPVDDFHFLAAGYPAEDLLGHFVAGHRGATVSLFPISQRLRYTIPFEEPEVTLRYLRGLHERDPNAVAVMADDGEKFGVWPDTHRWVYGEGGWLERFFAALEAEGDWLSVTTFERYLDRHPPRGTVAVPPASYFEMTEWALPAEAGLRFAELIEDLRERDLWERAKPFLRGGYWPNFQVKYPESNVMYRKMLRLSDRLSSTRKAPEEAHTELLRAQANCPYWHGVFGGLYLSHLRADVHQRLISSRRMLDEALHRSRRWTELERLDWDGDGEEEVHVELADQSWVLDPAEGAVLHYLDHKASGWPVSDVVARRFEAYHPSLQEAPDAAGGEHATIHDRPATGDLPPIERFSYDPHPRRWLTDHLLPLEVDPRAFQEAEYRELLDLPGLRHRIEEVTGGRGRASLLLEGVPVEGTSIRKELTARGSSLRIEYRLEGIPEGRFGPELPVSVWEGAAALRADEESWRAVEEAVALHGHVFELAHRGRDASVLLELPDPTELYAFPLRTISKSEAGYDVITQGVVLWPHRRMEGSGRFRMEVEVRGG